MNEGAPRSARKSDGRFVVLRHEGTPAYKPGVHWDLMFERGLALQTWALAELPTVDRQIDAEQLPDHRLAYLDYEGPISGDRGNVTRFDAGRFQLLSDSGEQFQATLYGEKLIGRISLRRGETTISSWRCEFWPD